jgi:hypothetical protein
MKVSESEVLKIEESESGLSCTDSTTLLFTSQLEKNKHLIINFFIFC